MSAPTIILDSRKLNICICILLVLCGCVYLSIVMCVSESVYKITTSTPENICMP